VDLVGAPVHQEWLPGVVVGVVDALQGRQFQRRERAVPSSVQTGDPAGQLVVGRRHGPGIGDGPPAVIVASRRGHRAAGLVEGDDAVVAARQVVVALAAPHAGTRIRDSVCALAGGAAGDDRGGRVLPAGDGVFAERRPGPPRISYTQTSGAWPRSCRDGSRMLIERHDTKTVVVLDASTGVRHTERSLPG